jgi:Chlamydia polymorphic membrane protein (Chlamydia_PMP) repeat
LRQESEGALTTIVIEDTTFYNNTAFAGGGAVYLASAAFASATVTSNSFEGNSSPVGGAMLIDTEKVVGLFLDKNIFKRNAATSAGGGGLLQSGETMLVDLTSNVFVDNAAQCCYAAQPQTVVDASCSDATAGFGTDT